MWQGLLTACSRAGAMSLPGDRGGNVHADGFWKQVLKKDAAHRTVEGLHGSSVAGLETAWNGTYKVIDYRQ